MRGDDLLALRQDMGMTQEALARPLGLTQTFIGLMERGVKPIEPRTRLAVLYLYEHPEARR